MRHYALVLTLFLVGCGYVNPPIKSHVTRVNSFDSNYLDGAVYFVERDSQKGSVEHQNYSNYAANKLREQGFTIARNAAEARYGVTLDYGIGDGVKEYSAYSNQYGTGITSDTVYTRYFKLNMYDLKRSTEDNIVGVYEGTVVSSGSTESFFTVSHCLIDALFRDFTTTGTDDTDFGFVQKMKGVALGENSGCLQ